MKNTFIRYSVSTCAALLAGMLVWAQAPAQTGSSATASAAIHAGPKKAVVEDPGERKFKENCSRCHNPPEVLSPRIAGTVLRHMRVRASLSPQDERDILHFLAP